jgi:hypothetical protein
MSNRLIVVNYPQGTGGKFLIAALGLSNSTLPLTHALQESTLIERMQFLQHELDKARLTSKWDDFNLYMTTYYGFEIPRVNDFLDNPTDQSIWDEIFVMINNSEMFNSLSKQNKYFFVDTHTLEIKNIRKFWPEATIILFNEQYQEFNDWRENQTYHRNCLKEDFWKNIKGTDWPDIPPYNSDEFHQLPTNIRDEIHNKFPDLLKLYVKETFHTTEDIDNVIMWRANDYLNYDKFMPAIARLYQDLGLDNFDIDNISRLYQHWYSTLDMLRFDK